jgi:hypothetical protein
LRVGPLSWRCSARFRSSSHSSRSSQVPAKTAYLASVSSPVSWRSSSGRALRASLATARSRPVLAVSSRRRPTRRRSGRRAATAPPTRSCSATRRSARRSTRRSQRGTTCVPPSGEPRSLSRSGHGTTSGTRRSRTRPRRATPQAYVQAKAGHSQGTITERYIHAAQVLLPGAAARAEERMFGAAERAK